MMCVTTDGEQRFKYCFWAFGSCIRGFNAVMRLVVAIDATHLKGRFKGILFVAACKDANEQIYPLAFSIGHVEDEESWSWFLNQLRRAIGCPENAMFISDQHLGIKNAVEKVYKDAHHVSANVQPMNSARTITRLCLGRRDMQLLFAQLGIPVSGTSPMTCNKLSFCHQVGEVKREDLRGKGFHQLRKAADDVDVHNARAMVTIDKIVGLRLHIYRQTGKHHLLSRLLDDVDPRHVQFADNQGTIKTTVQYGLQTLITLSVSYVKIVAL
ncbi:Uncharacterized protein TCM_039775 [Theobroma cacao]|uniref:MULE transposase domain-containing protein n=1 Tax=Theobroma cacao TaxID=3641 RepID=A0A061GS35_THECC|nr:Uncharacterized protein TCM_039775 [Theobroma cacao]